MENKDLSKLLIKDSEYYNSACAYVDVFNKNNITTINQLFDDELIKEVMKKCQKRTRSQISGLVSILKCKYLNEPLYTDVLLDKKIANKSNYSYVDYLMTLEDEEGKKQVDLISLLACPRGMCHVILSSFYQTINNPTLRNKNFPNDNIRLIDFLNWILTVDNPFFKQVYPSVKFYLDSYEKSSKITSEDIDNEDLLALKEELKFLVEKRNKLDSEINSLRNKISKINGGIQNEPRIS